MKEAKNYCSSDSIINCELIKSCPLLIVIIKLYKLQQECC